MSRKRFRHELRADVAADLYDRVVREAAARRITVAECIRRDLASFYAFRDELAEPIEPADPRRSGRRLVHKLLGDMEARLAATLSAGADETAAVANQLHKLEAMIDRLYLGLMLHLAEVPDDARQRRAASAEERHRSWRAAVEQSAAVASDRTAERHPDRRS